jgi:hypothetical protein
MYIINVVGQEATLLPCPVVVRSNAIMIGKMPIRKARVPGVPAPRGGSKPNRTAKSSMLPAKRQQMALWNFVGRQIQFGLKKIRQCLLFDLNRENAARPLARDNLCGNGRTELPTISSPCLSNQSYQP